MASPGDQDLHFWLARSVGRSIGLNFTEALQDGRLSAEGYAELVESCRRCTRTEACQQWLACEGGQGRARRAPGFCAIGLTLAALKPH